MPASHCQSRLTRLLFLALPLCVLQPIVAQQPVSFPGTSAAVLLHADLYGDGSRAVILAHGGRFGKESWKPQATTLAASGFLVLALQFRGDGPNPDGSPGSSGSPPDNAADVLAAATYLKQHGAASIYAIGASFGGDAVGDAAASAPPGTFSRLIFLGSEGGGSPQKLSGRKLFLVARADRSGDGLRLPGIRSHFTSAPPPKQLIILKGSAHAQFLFATPQAPRLTRTILHFLTEP